MLEKSLTAVLTHKGGKSVLSAGDWQEKHQFWVEGYGEYLKCLCILSSWKCVVSEGHKFK